MLFYRIKKDLAAQKKFEKEPKQAQLVVEYRN